MRLVGADSVMAGTQMPALVINDPLLLRRSLFTAGSATNLSQFLAIDKYGYNYRKNTTQVVAAISENSSGGTTVQ